MLTISSDIVLILNQAKQHNTIFTLKIKQYTASQWDMTKKHI